MRRILYLLTRMIAATNPPFTSTPTTSYTGPGVQSAEDPTTRNRIIIAVVSTVVGIGFISAVAFLYAKRRNAGGTSTPDSANPTFFPTIQPGLISDHAVPVPPPHPSTPNGPVPAPLSRAPTKRTLSDDLEAQARMREVFKRRQESFKEQREFARKSRSKISLESPSDESLPTEEQEIITTMTATMNDDSAAKNALYRELVLRWHPDKCPGDVKVATRVFQFIRSKKAWYLPGSPSSPNSPK